MDTSGRVECQPNTMVDFLESIATWLMTPSDSCNILWLYGVAGCGKTTIANTIAEYFRELGRLGSLNIPNLICSVSKCNLC
jgi:signal recognition particle GTPase